MRTPQRKRRIRVEIRRPKAATNEKPIPRIPLPFEEVMQDMLKVRPLQKEKTQKLNPKQGTTDFRS